MRANTMVNELNQEDTFNYFLICKICIDEECCAEPYFTFCARNEIDKIKEKIKDFPEIFHDFLEVDTIMYNGEVYEWYGIKKVNGRCIFLKNRRICMIQDVKPLHCRCYPLVWEYDLTHNKLLICLDTHPDCALVPLISKDKQWLIRMKEIIVNEVQQMPMIDRIAYSSLDCDDTLQLIDTIDLL